MPSGSGEGAGGRGLPIPAAEYTCFCISSRVAWKPQLVLACTPPYRRVWAGAASVAVAEGDGGCVGVPGELTQGKERPARRH